MIHQSQVSAPAAVEAFLLFLKGIQRFAAGLAMPHQHSLELGSIQQSYRLPARPAALRECRVTPASSTCPWAQGTLCAGPRACEHPRHGSTAVLSTAVPADEVPLVSNHLGFTVRTLLCRYSYQYICFLRRSANVPLPSLRGGRLQPNRQSVSCAVPRALRNPGNSPRSLDA